MQIWQPLKKTHAKLSKFHDHAKINTMKTDLRKINLLKVDKYSIDKGVQMILLSLNLRLAELFQREIRSTF